MRLILNRANANRPRRTYAGAGVTITWKGKHNGSTTVGNVSVTSPGQGACKASSTENDFIGTVTANTSEAKILGTTVSGQACVDGSDNISLVKHTTLTF